MTLPLLPADWAPDDTPTADQLNRVKAHAGYHVDQLNTVLTRTLVQPISTNSITPMSWQVVAGARNGMGWSLGVPTRLPCPAGGGGQWEAVANLRFDAVNNTGFRQMQLRKNGTDTIPGLPVPGSTAIFGELTAIWHLEMAAGDYVELVVWQNSGVSINIMVAGISPQISMRRIQT